MAIYTIKDRTKEHVKQLLEDVGNVCFYCWGDLFDDPEHSTGGVVVWMGPERPNCAASTLCREISSGFNTRVQFFETKNRDNSQIGSKQT